MHRAPFNERAEFYKYTHAAQSMGLSLDILKEIEKLGPGLQGWQKYVAWGSLATCYFRAFTQTPKNLYAIRDSLVPSHLTEFHVILRNLRNKVFAHTEADFQDVLIPDTNSLVFRILDDGVPHFGFAWPNVNHNRIPFFRELFLAIHAAVHNESIRIWNSWLHSINDPIVGTNHKVWRLNLDPANDDIFLPETDDSQNSLGPTGNT